MEMHEMVEALDILSKAREGRALLAWTCTEIPDDQHLVRAEYTFLLSLRSDRGVGTTLEKIPVSYVRYFDKPSMAVCHKGLVRITSGDRERMTLPPEMLKDGETFRRAGVTKMMRIGRSSEEFKEGREVDENLVRYAWEAFGEKEATEVSDLPVPRMMISVKDTNHLRVRMNKKVWSELSHIRGYDHSLPMDVNVERLIQYLVMPQGPFLLADFAQFYGKGRLLIGAELTGTPYLMPLDWKGQRTDTLEVDI